MAQIDVIIRETVLKYIIPIGIVVFLLLVYLGELTKPVRDVFFRGYLKDFSKTYEEKLKEYREMLLKNLDQLVSKVTDLRNRGLIRILEVGVGCGQNLQYYPQQCRLIVVDPRPHFMDYFMDHRESFPDICLEDYLVTGAEHMQGIADGSVDVVVATSVLCSVNDVDKTLKEILRVLVKGGRFYFLEHVIDFPHAKRYKYQKWLTKLGLWPWMFDGCRLDRDIDNIIARSGFSDVDQRRFFIEPDGSRALRLMSPHVMGLAIK